MRLATIVQIAKLAAACRENAHVTVEWQDGSGSGHVYTEGVARHIVEPDSCAFAYDITRASRLRVSGTFEAFIPLGRIIAVYGAGILSPLYDREAA